MKAFFGTALGKILIGVLAAALVAGGGFAVYKAVQPNAAPAAAITEPETEEVTTAEAPATAIVTTTEEETTEPPTTTAKPTTTARPTTTTKAVTAPKDSIVLTGKTASGKVREVTMTKKGNYWSCDERFEYDTAPNFEDPYIFPIPKGYVLVESNKEADNTYSDQVAVDQLYYMPSMQLWEPATIERIRKTKATEKLVLTLVGYDGFSCKYEVPLVNGVPTIPEFEALRNEITGCPNPYLLKIDLASMQGWNHYSACGYQIDPNFTPQQSIFTGDYFVQR